MTRWAAAVGLVALALAPARAGAQPACVACHASRAEPRLRAPVAAARDDVHGAADVLCVDCHGGDADEPTVRAHSLALGFRGVPDPLGASLLCGRCHDGSREDAPAVLAEFRGGAHGRALARGEPAPATCTSCHGAHGIVATDAPTSPTARANVAATCGVCHGESTRLGAAELRTDVVAAYARSVHAHALEAGSEVAPTCPSCHGPHQNAAGVAASMACATCHLEVRAAFDAGPHGEAFGRLGFTDCAECHDSHEVRPADATLLHGLPAACGRCHGEDQPAVFERVAAIGASGRRLDALRGATAPDDPGRAAAILALHRLDADALEAALEGVPEPPADAPRPPAPPPAEVRTPGLSPRLLVAGLSVLVALAALVLLVRGRKTS